MRIARLSRRQQVRVPSRSPSRQRVLRLVVLIALLLITGDIVVQSGPMDVQGAGAATIVNRGLREFTSRDDFAAPAAAVRVQTAPANDDFANATVLGADAGSLTTETNVDASAESGEPNHNGLAGTPARSVWYQWTPSVDGVAVFGITVPPVPNDWDMVLAAYTGSAVDDLTEVAAKSASAYSLVLQFEVAAGTTYHLAVDGHDSGEYGNFDFTWVTHVAPLNDDFANATVLGADAGSLTGGSNEWATAESGEPNHDGLAGTPVHSVWYQWTPSVDAAATFEMITPVSPDDWDNVLAVYTGTGVGTLTEVAANCTAGTYLLLNFSVTGGTTYHLAVDGQAAGQMGSFDLTWSIWPDEGYFVVTKTEDTNDGVCDADCSLREAVNAANTTPGDDLIDLPAGVYSLTLSSGTSDRDYGDIDIERESGTITMVGAGAETTIIDASSLTSRNRVFEIHYMAGLDISGVTITGGYACDSSGSGGGIRNWNGTLVLSDSVIAGNDAYKLGGGIATTYGTTIITGTLINGNTTDHAVSPNGGGGVYNGHGTVTIINSEITGNVTGSAGLGGGIANAATLNIRDSLISGNHGHYGGGIGNNYNLETTSEEWTVTITNCTVTDNFADTSYSNNEGGGIFNGGYGLGDGDEGRVIITDSTISGNWVKDGDGGGVFSYGGVVEIYRSSLSDNVANGGGYGGGVFSGHNHTNWVVGTVTISNSTISGNGATHGGGVANHDRASTTIENTTITDNTALSGGGIANTGVVNASVSIDNTIVAQNATPPEPPPPPQTEDCEGAITSAGHNLVGFATGCPSSGIGDLTTPDPLLGPLADNGGPTPTHRLLATSPALDAGDTSLTVDQRGVARPQGPADDIGAFEAVLGPNTAPILDAIGDQSVAEADTLDVEITASDADGDPLTFTLSEEPSFATLTDHGDGTATLTLAPGFDDDGTYTGVTVTVSDSSTQDSETFTITVTDVETMPVFLPLVLRNH
jgi:CSLREA domain-containing protein